MPADRIERQIDIDAPIDIVGRVITEPEHITGWFTDTIELDVEPAARGRFGWEREPASCSVAVNVCVERVDPPTFFSFRWNYPDGSEPSEENAPLVEFSLEPRGDTTRVHLVESGIASLLRPEEEKDRYHADHSNGWDTIGERLRTYAAEQRGVAAG